MAAAADDSTAYGGGAGGKFRKRPFRRPQTTPYDRPPTALRIARRNNDNITAGGWLSRIVDPASRLITAGAHKLFSSVFRKRLLPPPQPSQDEKAEHLENHLEDAMIEAPSSQARDMNIGSLHNNVSMTDEVSELEHILNQKTFTRSEIDRLTVLLHSRSVDKTTVEGQVRFELTPSEPLAAHSRQKETRGTAFGDGANPSEVSESDLTRAVRSNVNVDVASPSELAKAYMGGRSTRVSPPILGSQSQAVGEETPAFTTLKLQRTSVVSTVQKPFSPAGTSQKDFVVPRSRGRSAIYSMARTPYSRVQQTVTKGLGTNNDADGHSLLSSQKVLKRRCSVLENDIGVVGPIRRIRQKPNLLYSKTLGLPSSATPFTNSSPSVVGEASSSKSHEDRGEKYEPHSGSHVSSKSIEMGQRILQHLEKLTPPKEKSIEKSSGFSGGISGMKLTSAMLRGQARKSLETVDPLKCVQQDNECEKMVNSSNALHEVQDVTPKEHTRFCDSNSKVLMNSSSKEYPENGEARSTDVNGMVITKNIAPVFIKSAVDVPKRSPAFQMSAYEDFLDMDDDVQLNGVASPTANEDKRYLRSSSVQSNGKLPKHFAEPTKSGSPFPGMESSSNSAPKTNTAVESSNIAEKGISSFYTDSSLKKTIGSSPSTSVPHEADIPVSTISSGLKRSDKVSSPSLVTSVVQSSVTKDVTSSGFAFADAVIKSPGSNNKSIEGVNLFDQLVRTPACVPESSTGTISSLGSFPLASAAPSAVLFSSQSSSGGSSAQSTLTASITGASATKVGTITAATIAINGCSDSLASSVALPSFQPTFSGSSAISNSAKIATLGTDPAGKSEEIASGITQGSAPVGFQFGGLKTSSSGSMFSDQVLASKTATASTAENISNQAAASALPASSGSSGLPVTSGSLTSVSAPFSSLASGSTSSASTNLSVASWQPTNSPGSGSAFNNSSSGLSFGTSSAAVNDSLAGSSGSVSPSLIFGAAASSTSVSSGLTFGTSSSNGSSDGAPFGTSSTSSPSASISSVFGFGASSSASSIAPSSTFSFGLASAPASSTAPSSTFSFGGSSAFASSSSVPSSTFSFGASSASAASSAAPSSTFSFGASSASASSSAVPSSTFLFGASSASASSSAAPSSTFSFAASTASAASSAAPSSTFLFGASSASASSSAAPSSTFSFGASAASAASSAASAASSAAPSSTFSFGASSAASSSAPSSTFSFGASAASAASSAAPSSTFLFGASSASVSATPAPVFPFGSGAPTPASTIFQTSQPPAFGGNNSNSVFGFGSTPSPMGNNDQMNMEDTMLEDSMQSPTVATPTPVFGQSPTSNFPFGMAQVQVQAPAPAPLGASPFQFASQQNQVAAAPNPFQASGSFDGGSFSLGAGGNDKSNRRIVKVKGRNRKK